ncbi:uncharacterized protein [Drosophila tropicalis]|uniref:uncharacterized protein n=1 Tax=Drosophila tropicalis TaxID=46794 RepID=UPI0035AC0ED6
MDLVELVHLKKYIPFIHYLLQNGEQNVKFKEMMYWIKNNKRFKQKVVDLIEESLRVRYSRLLTDKRLPQWIHDLFKDKIEHVDLDSSDEEDVVILENTLPYNITSNAQKPNEKINIENVPEEPQPDSQINALVNREHVKLFRKTPLVLLKKLTNKSLEKYHIQNNNDNHNSPTLNVELVEGRKETVKASKGQNKRASSQIFILNTDTDMTEQNTTTCIICYSKPRDLTNHFVRIHKVESYVSRLTDEILNELRDKSPVAQKEENGNHYTIVCAFCKDTVRDLFVNFYNHFSSHTGEYAFYCSYCKLKKPYREDMLAHIGRSKTCYSAKIYSLYVYNDQQTVIYLYQCKLCNFVQLNAANIEKHILDHHGSHYDSNAIERYEIATTSDPAREIEVANGLPEPDKKSDIFADIKSIKEEDVVTTFNAAVCETFLPSDDPDLNEEYFTTLMLSADDLKIEVDD